MGKLTKAQIDIAILRAIADRAMDTYDIADATRIDHPTVYAACLSLRAHKLVLWMYPEDEVAISPAGRAALHPEQSP